MKYELLNNISGAIVLFAVTIVFSMLFEARYPLKKYLSSLIPFLTVLFTVNFYVIFKDGFSAYGKITVLIATIPSLIYFFITSKSRDGRFFFTFCLVDTASIWFALLTGLIDYFLNGNGLFNFYARCLSLPLILFSVYKWGRRPFLDIKHTVKKGWWLFTAMTGLIYLLLIVLCSVPKTLRERPEDIPIAVIITFLLPFFYIAIFYVLNSQKKLLQMGTIQHAFSAQSAMMKSRAEEIRSAEEKIRIERHDLKHQLKIIEELAVKDEKEDMLKYIGSVERILDESNVHHYCVNPILDAILSSYFRKAKESGISVESHIIIPDALPVADVELATVFANAFENAINACRKLPEKDRKISIICIVKPSLMFEIKNTYKGTVKFDSSGIPLSQDEGHGIGSRSILAFCKKYNADCTYDTKDGLFTLTILL